MSDSTEMSSNDNSEMNSSEADKTELEKRQRIERYKEERRKILRGEAYGVSSCSFESFTSPARKRRVSVYFF